MDHEASTGARRGAPGRARANPLEIGLPPADDRRRGRSGAVAHAELVWTLAGGAVGLLVGVVLHLLAGPLAVGAGGVGTTVAVLVAIAGAFAVVAGMIGVFVTLAREGTGVEDGVEPAAAGRRAAADVPTRTDAEEVSA